MVRGRRPPRDPRAAPGAAAAGGPRRGGGRAGGGLPRPAGALRLHDEPRGTGDLRARPGQPDGLPPGADRRLHPARAALDQRPRRAGHRRRPAVSRELRLDLDRARHGARPVAHRLRRHQLHRAVRRLPGRPGAGARRRGPPPLRPRHAAARRPALPLRAPRVPDRDEAAQHGLRHRHVDEGDRPAAAAARLHPRRDVLLASDPLRPVRQPRLRQRLRPVLEEPHALAARRHRLRRLRGDALDLVLGAVLAGAADRDDRLGPRPRLPEEPLGDRHRGRGGAPGLPPRLGAGRAVHLHQREPHLRPGRRRAPARRLPLRHARGAQASVLRRRAQRLGAAVLAAAPDARQLLADDRGPPRHPRHPPADDRHRDGDAADLGGAGPRRGRPPLPLGLPDRALRPDPHLEHRAHLGAGHRLRDGLSRRRRLVLQRRPPGGARRSRAPAARARGRAPGRSGRRARRRPRDGPGVGSDCATATRGL